jgi:hypothetical protein
MGGAYRKEDETRNTYKLLVGGPEGRRLLGIHRCIWEDNIKVCLKRTG